MCDESRTSILKGLAAGNVIVVSMAVNDVLDGRLRDLPYFLDIGFCCRPPQADRIGSDDTALVTTNID